MSIINILIKTTCGLIFCCFAQAVLAAPFSIGKDRSMVYDHATRLIWKRCPMGQSLQGEVCIGMPARYAFKDVAAALAAANDNGVQWRMPHAEELYTLIKCEHGISPQISAKFLDELRNRERVSSPQYELCRNHQQGNYSIDFDIFPSNVKYVNENQDTYREIWTDDLHDGNRKTYQFQFRPDTVTISWGTTYLAYRSFELARVMPVVQASPVNSYLTEQFPFLDEDQTQLFAQKFQQQTVDLPWKPSTEIERTLLDKRWQRPPLQQSLLAMTMQASIEKTSVLPSVRPEPVRKSVGVTLSKGEFETTPAYEARLASAVKAANEGADAEFLSAQRARENDVRLRDAALAKAQKELTSPQLLPALVTQAWRKLAPEALGNPLLSDVKYDADKQEFSATLSSSRGSFTQKITANAALAIAPQLKQDLLSGKVAPAVIFKFPEMSVSWTLQENAAQRAERFANARNSKEDLLRLIREFPNAAETALAKKRLFELPTTSKELHSLVLQYAEWGESKAASQRIPALQRAEYQSAVQRQSSAAYQEFINNAGGPGANSLIEQATSAMKALKAKEEREEREAAARRERERPRREARSLCEAQKQTCVAACPVNRYTDGSVMGPEYFCQKRCDSVSCN